MAKKSYVVVFRTSRSGDAYSAFGDVEKSLKLHGKTIEVSLDRSTLVLAFMPDSETMDARKVKETIAEVASPFYDSVLVAGVDCFDVADAHFGQVADFMSGGEKENGEPRNFQRFATRRDAEIAYKNEKPKWFYPDGSGATTSVDFDREWPWLPIRKDGLYTRGKFEKYL